MRQNTKTQKMLVNIISKDQRQNVMIENGDYFAGRYKIG